MKSFETHPSPRFFLATIIITIQFNLIIVAGLFCSAVHLFTVETVIDRQADSEDCANFSLFFFSLDGRVFGALRENTSNQIIIWSQLCYYNAFRRRCEETFVFILVHDFVCNMCNFIWVINCNDFKDISHLKRFWRQD